MYKYHTLRCIVNASQDNLLHKTKSLNISKLPKQWDKVKNVLQF